MARTLEKLTFAERLRLALGRSTQRISTATELALQFNLRYPGKQVTNQAVQKWLSGDNRPTPDKIEVLATMLSISPIWLRHGIEQGPTGKPRIAQQTPSPIRPKTNCTRSAATGNSRPTSGIWSAASSSNSPSTPLPIPKAER